MATSKDKPVDETTTDQQPPASEPSAAREAVAAPGQGLRYRVAYPTGISVVIDGETQVIPRGALLPTEVPDSTASILFSIGHLVAAQ